MQKKESKITFLDQEIDKEKKTNTKTGSIIWGIILIFAGITFFLNTFYGVSWEIWSKFFQFWPLVLILIGIQIILGNNIISRILILFASLFVIGLAFLLALDEVSPNLVENLPSDILNLLQFFKGGKVV